MAGHVESAVEVEVGALGEALIAAADSARIGVSLTFLDRPTAKVSYINDAGVDILGHSREHILSVPAVDLLVADDIEMVDERRERLRQGLPVPHWYDTATVRADGRRVPVHVGMTYLQVGGRRAVLSYFLDASERMAALDALARSEKRFREVVESAPDAVWMFDGKRLTYVNPALVRILGYPDAATALATNPIQIVHPDDRELLVSRIQRMLSEGVSLGPQEYRIYRPDGRLVVLDVLSIVVEWEGKPHLLTFGRDVSARKEVEARLVQADRLAVLGTTVAGIAHEINNPLMFSSMAIEQALASLGGATSLADLQASLRDTLSDARAGIERVAATVRELRTIARPEDGVRTRFSLADPIRTAARFAQNEIRHRARFEMDLDDVASVEGSAPRLEQLFVNLLVNAAQAMPEGQGQSNRVSVRLRQDAALAIAEVTDNGVGIPEANRERIFDPFFSTKPQGMGLGLAICREIVVSHGGSIEMENPPAGGTTFRVRLPTVASNVIEDAPSPRPPAAPAPAVKGRLLVVDDEPLLGRLLCRALSDFETFHVSSAQDALVRLQEDSFDIVLCDLMMPFMTGMELYATVVQRRPDLADCFVFMTGGTFTAVAREFVERTHRPVIEKPFTPAALSELLAKLLGH